MALPPGPVGLKFWQPQGITADPQPVGWTTLYEVVLATETTLDGNITVRHVITTAGYNAAAVASGSKLRITIQSNAATGATWDKVYIGHAAASGDAADFDGTQVQLLWSGSASGNVAVASTLVSDEINYAFDKTKNLIISIHTTGAPSSVGLKYNSSPPAGFSRGIKVSADEAATTDINAADYSFFNHLIGFTKVEVYSGPVADSGPITLPADAGSYALTGSNIGLGLGYSLTGSDAAFVTASAGTTTLTAGAGSYTLTGTAAGLVYSATLTAGAGSYALTGSAIGLGLGYRLIGSDAAFVTASSGVTTLTAAAGSYALTGSSAALALRHTAAAGSYTLTGSAAAFIATDSRVLIAGPGSYALTGSAAALGSGFTAGSNNYALTGAAAAYRITLATAAGSYVLTGTDAALVVAGTITLTGEAGSYVLTGADAAFVVASPVTGGVIGRYYPPTQRPLPVVGRGYGILPQFVGEAHGVVVAATGNAAGTLPGLAAVATASAGVVGGGEVRFLVRAHAIGVGGTHGTGAGMITLDIEGTATGRHDDDEAAVLTFLLDA